jgi:hypothetical protein
MSEDERRQEIRELIEFYEARGWNWLGAAEFVLAKHSGTFDIVTRGGFRPRIGAKRGRPRNPRP